MLAGKHTFIGTNEDNMMTCDEPVPENSRADLPTTQPSPPQPISEPLAELAQEAGAEPTRRKRGRPRKNESTAPPKCVLPDALELWGGESPHATPPSRLSVFKIEGNEKLFVPFTTHLAPVELHYLDGPTFRGFTRCATAGCILCLIGKRADPRHLLPVFDPLAKRVAVLPVPPAQRPGSLAPLLLPLLRRVQAGELFIVGVARKSDFSYAVRTLPLPDDADVGAALIPEFAAELEAGRVDLTASYPVMTAADVFSVPELAAEAALRGIRT